MIFLSTPFSMAAADRLNDLGVVAFKIGSGECNNYPLIEHIAKFGKPVILSTGMNDIPSIRVAVFILQEHKIPLVLLHCTSIYPTPDKMVRLESIKSLQEAFPAVLTGFSDHSLTIYPALASIALKAVIIERHFTSDKGWPGPDIPISMDPAELKELIRGSKIIHKAMEGKKTVLPEEMETAKFAYASVVAIKGIKKGDLLDEKNIGVKRPGTGEIPAVDYDRVIGRTAARDIPKNSQVGWNDVSENLPDATK